MGGPTLKSVKAAEYKEVVLKQRDFTSQSFMQLHYLVQLVYTWHLKKKSDWFIKVKPQK